MANFKLDDCADFETNLSAFLDHMEVEDAELGAILRAHISKLKGATNDIKRRASRSAFNASVAPDLDALLGAAEKETSA